MQAHEEREWQTRKTRIDGCLKGQGRKVVPFDPSRPLSAYAHHAIEEYPTDTEGEKLRLCPDAGAR
jgi:hypothetical protein